MTDFISHASSNALVTAWRTTVGKFLRPHLVQQERLYQLIDVCYGHICAVLILDCAMAVNIPALHIMVNVIGSSKKPLLVSTKL